MNDRAPGGSKHVRAADKTNTQWLPVRCCCQPKKIFGFIRLPMHLVNGSEFKRITAKDGTIHDIIIKSFYETDPGNWDVEKAVYSDGRPIEFWRNFPNFIESQ